MFFTIENKKSQKISIPHLKFNARTFVILCKKGVTDRLIERYLVKNYNTLLVPACLYIINHASYSFNEHGDLVITFVDKELDKLASIITFGTGKFLGSDILRYAFSQM